MAEKKILFATSEVAPLIKTGGLADVSSALPAALRAMGLGVHVLVPGYNQVIAQLMQYEVAAIFDNLPGFPSSRLLSSRMMHDVPLLVLDCPSLYQRDGGPYQDVTGHDWADNALPFGLLSRVAAVLGSSASPLDWHPDLVHCNDWQTGLTPAYLHFAQGAVPSIIAIHNLAFQGIFTPLSEGDLHGGEPVRGSVAREQEAGTAVNGLGLLPLHGLAGAPIVMLPPNEELGLGRDPGGGGIKIADPRCRGGTP